jgi:hypothetical protein
MAAATAPIGKSADARRTLRRAGVVWGVFLLATAAAVGVLQVSSFSTRRLPERTTLAASAGALRTTSITPRYAEIDRIRWTSIVIHHSGTPGGDAASMDRKAIQEGLTGLGYHFIVGNGQGLDDGQIAVGYRWDRQLAGAHVAQSAPNASRYNEHAVAICLVGNGERRAFTERQIHELIGLVRQLQAELGISAAEVHLHGSLSGTASPGQFFPTSEVMSQILP